MMPSYTFSIIIPAFNRAGKIGTAIRSVLAQSYPGFEIIVVDDGSTDDTEAVVKQFHDPRIHYIFQENRERGAARNTGTRSAKGELITFLDSDDEFLPGHLQAAHDFIENNKGIDVYCSSYKIVSPEKIIFIKMPADIRGELVHGNFLSCNGVFLRKEIAEKFQFTEDRSLAGLEDWELWLRIAAEKTMTGNNKFTSQMNQHDDRSVLQTTQENIEARFISFYQHVFTNPKINEFYKDRLHLIRASCETYMALHLALAKKSRKVVLDHLFRGMRLAPRIIFQRRFYAILKHIL